MIDFSLNPSKYKFLEIVPTIIKDKYYLLGEEYKKKGIPYSPFLQYTPDDLIIEDKRKIDDYFDYYKRHILLENYDEIPETTEEILELMEKSKENSKILGYTKWFEKEGEQKWRECEIETYDKHEKLFTIKIFIQKNNSYLNKKVTRFNILFKGEDLAKLDFRVKLAKKWIYFAKKYMALFHFVDNFKVSNFPQLNMEEFMDKIFHLVYFYRGVNLKQLNPLEVVNLENSMRFGIWRRNARKREIKLDKMKIRKMLNSKKIDAAKIEEIFNDINFYYSRSFQIIEFYKRLPFNYDYFLLLKEIIPKERFLMPSERFLYPSESIGTIQTKRALPFLEVYRIMEKKLHQSDKDTSSLLIDQKMQFLVIGDMCFFYSNWYVKPIDIEFYKKKNEENIEGVYKEIKFMIGNTNHQITTFIKKRLEEANKINKGATIPIAVINKFRCFQELSNEMIKNLTRS